MKVAKEEKEHKCRLVNNNKYTAGQSQRDEIIVVEKISVVRKPGTGDIMLDLAPLRG